jgi:hypothetical protein
MVVYSSCFNSLDIRGCFSSFFLFVNEKRAILIGPTQNKNKNKKLKLLRLPTIEFFWRIGCLPLGPTIQVRKGRTLGKAYRIKVWC